MVVLRFNSGAVPYNCLLSFPDNVVSTLLSEFCSALAMSSPLALEQSVNNNHSFNAVLSCPISLQRTSVEQRAVQRCRKQVAKFAIGKKECGDVG
jgi:hypothetical protein